ncbi:MAG TPA: hypothetical protein VKD72_11940 [Gemmataceae bacterium]|nr:hypothetical protein [Gemmataceae bacterium]
MKVLYAFAVAAVAGLTLLADANIAQAAGPGCNGPFCNQPKYPFGGGSLFGHLNLGKQRLPVFQAAPWYLYWPYDAHFLTPAPVTGPFYAPPTHGNFPVNPYFPAPHGAAGYGFGYGLGGIPGGPPPAGYPVPLPPHHPPHHPMVPPGGG